MLNGPCSTTVILLHPRETSSSAKLVPTMPAPMMTTRCEVVILGCLFVPSNSMLGLPEGEADCDDDLGSSLWAKDAREYWPC